jgi:hypothetical protein
VFNQRKNRNGAFWEDRFHAIAIKDGDHFFRCCAYIEAEKGDIGPEKNYFWNITG